jgi:hypothetical protein
MRYTQPQNVWDMTRDQMRQMQPGQWVYAGDRDSKGQFLGVKRNDVVVVAWYGNAKRHEVYVQYIRDLRNFAKGT